MSNEILVNFDYHGGTFHLRWLEGGAISIALHSSLSKTPQVYTIIKGRWDINKVAIVNAQTVSAEDKLDEELVKIAEKAFITTIRERVVQLGHQITSQRMQLDDLTRRLESTEQDLAEMNTLLGE